MCGRGLGLPALTTEGKKQHKVASFLPLAQTWRSLLCSASQHPLSAGLGDIPAGAQSAGGHRSLFPGPHGTSTVAAGKHLSSSQAWSPPGPHPTEGRVPGSQHDPWRAGERGQVGRGLWLPTKGRNAAHMAPSARLRKASLP